MSDSHTSNTDDHKSPDALEREVDEARQRMSQTVDSLGTRLSPGELVDQFIGTAREHGGELTRNFGGQVKQNPIPALLTTVGIAWLMAGSKNDDSSDANYAHTDGAYGDSSYGESALSTRDGSSSNGSSIGQTVKDTLEAGKDKLVDGKDNAADRIGSAKSSVSGQASIASEKAKVQASELQRQMQQFMEEQPLVAGTIGLALGAALGALVPPSAAEDRMVGQASDKATERAKEVAAEKYEQGRETVKKTAQDMKDTVQKDKPSMSEAHA